MRSLLSLAASALVLSQGTVPAATITYGPESIPEQPSNWSHTITLPKFDPSFGILTEVSFSLSGTVHGSARAESLDSSPSTVTTNLQARVTLRDPTGNALVVALPQSQQIDMFTAYDGTTDFAGTSGSIHDNLVNGDTQNGTASDLAAFIGPGTVSLPIDAVGESSAFGFGNLISQFNTSASASASVTYTFEIEQIPEPSSASLLMVAGIFAVARRRRRR